MPSPIAHTAVGYAIYLLGRSRPAVWQKDVMGARLRAFCIGVSLMPDVDSVIGLIKGDFGRYHNNLSHSFVIGLLASMLIGRIAGRSLRVSRRRLFFLSFAAYSLHIVMDAANVGRGVKLLWPLSAQRFKAPWPLYYGLHWSDGLISVRHLWTFATEIAFAGALVWLVRRVIAWRDRLGQSVT